MSDEQDIQTIRFKPGIANWLMRCGWKRWLGSWWYKPLPGWKGKLAQGQEICGQRRAFEIERGTIKPAEAVK